MLRMQRRRKRGRTLRSGEISTDLRSARRSAISASASASPAPLKSTVPAGLVGLGGIGEGKEQRVWGRHRESSGCVAWASSWPEGDARTEACTRTQQTRGDAALLGLGRVADWCAPFLDWDL